MIGSFFEAISRSAISGGVKLAKDSSIVKVAGLRHSSKTLELAGRLLKNAPNNPEAGSLAGAVLAAAKEAKQAVK